jgi:hypothetical protein
VFCSLKLDKATELEIQKEIVVSKLIPFKASENSTEICPDFLKLIAE